MMNTIKNNNAHENEFRRTHNQYKYTPHIDSYSPQGTGFGSFDYKA